jgi:hypothetical protein
LGDKDPSLIISSRKVEMLGDMFEFPLCRLSNRVKHDTQSKEPHRQEQKLHLLFITVPAQYERFYSRIMSIKVFGHTRIK